MNHDGDILTGLAKTGGLIEIAVDQFTSPFLQQRQIRPIANQSATGDSLLPRLFRHMTADKPGRPRDKDQIMR
jgi:hypothetical protein